MIEKGVPLIRGERILMIALNWGDGHLMRSIALAKYLLKNNTVCFAATKRQSSAIRYYLPNAEILDWKGFDFRFERKGSRSFAMQVFMRSLSLWVEERSLVRKVKIWRKAERLTMVLADQIYLPSLRNLTTVFLTHQLTLPLPWHWRWVQLYNRLKMRRFDEVWVMDEISTPLAGKLSAPIKGLNLRYIGWWSRFSDQKPRKKEKVLALMSGPESLRKKEFFKEQLGVSTAFEDIQWIGSIGDEIPNWSAIDEGMCAAKVVISHGGYTTRMDQLFLGFDLLAFPAEQQWEQIYLNTLSPGDCFVKR